MTWETLTKASSIVITIEAKQNGPRSCTEFIKSFAAHRRAFLRTETILMKGPPLFTIAILETKSTVATASACCQNYRLFNESRKVLTFFEKLTQRKAFLPPQWTSTAAAELGLIVKPLHQGCRSVRHHRTTWSPSIVQRTIAFFWTPLV